MTLDEQLRLAARRITEHVVVPAMSAAAIRAHADARRRRTWSITTAAAVAVVVAVILVSTSLFGGKNTSAPGPGDPARQPEAVRTSAAVWYDDAGLHHGNQVDPTPFPLVQARGEVLSVLALVRDGALYVDPENGDVWFHAWDSPPRVVGHDSATGPGGSPDGTVAAWFEGRELVVYDTASDVEMSRTPETPALADPFRKYVGGLEHVVGNGFMHVSAEGVVWRSTSGIRRLDLVNGQASWLWRGPATATPRLEDVRDGTRVWGDYKTGTLRVDVGKRRLPLPNLEPMGRLSPDGTFVVSAWDTGGSLGVGFVDLGSGQSWEALGKGWNAWIAWTYANVAVLRVESGTSGPDLGLFACGAEARACSRLPSSGSVLLPSS